MGGIFILHGFNMVATIAIVLGIFFYKKLWGKFSDRAKLEESKLESIPTSSSNIDGTMQSKVDDEIAFRPEPQRDFVDMYVINFATGNPVHPLQNIGRKRKSRELEKQFQEHATRMEQLFDSRFQHLFEQFQYRTLTSSNESRQMPRDVQDPQSADDDRGLCSLQPPQRFLSRGEYKFSQQTPSE